MLRITTLVISAVLALLPIRFAGSSGAYDFNDSHFHITNYVQEGLNLPDFLKIMGNRAGPGGRLRHSITAEVGSL
jgi:hypothetical protein